MRQIHKRLSFNFPPSVFFQNVQFNGENIGSTSSQLYCSSLQYRDDVVKYATAAFPTLQTEYK